MRPDQVIRSIPIPIFYRIGFLANHFREPILRSIEMEFGLSRSEISTLFCTTTFRSANASDICDFTGIPKNTVSRALSQLEKKGLISRVTDPTDRRSAIIKSLAKGRSLTSNIVERVIIVEQKMSESLTKKEQETLSTLLEKMCLSALHRD